MTGMSPARPVHSASPPPAPLPIALQPSRGLWHWIPKFVLPLLILFAIGTVWLRLYIVRTTYAINQADREIREHKQVLSQAELKVTSQRSPKNLEAIAKQKFNLNPPRPDQLIPLRTSGAPGAKK